MSRPTSILFICLGNICRSPLVEGVARQRLAEAGIDISVASCGTGHWHAGERADVRMRLAAKAAGFDIESHRARQLVTADFKRYDLLLAMDSDNLGVIRSRAPQDATAATALFLEWTAAAPPASFPDPYTGDTKDFVYSVELAERGVAGLIRRWRANG